MNPVVFVKLLTDSTRKNPSSSIGGIMAGVGIYMGWVGLRMPATDTEMWLGVAAIGCIILGMGGADGAKVLENVLEQAAGGVQAEAIAAKAVVETKKAEKLEAIVDAVKPEASKPELPPFHRTGQP